MAAADFLLRLAIIEKNADGGEKISLTKSLAFYPQVCCRMPELVIISDFPNSEYN